MKVMISQPMNGKSEEQIRQERDELINKIQEDGDTYIDTIFQYEVPEGYDIPIYYLAKSIEAIAYVDKIIFMNGWDKARGCLIEHEVATSYDKIIAYYKD
jgi:hypothetical protein